jgi:hypothetical protein
MELLSLGGNAADRFDRRTTWRTYHATARFRTLRPAPAADRRTV